MKQYAPACDRNRDFILDVLREVLLEPGRVLEIGSGTGQHAAYFSGSLPHVTWQPTDVPDALASIEAWRAETGAANLLAPLTLDLLDDAWPVETADAVVCINTIHIVPWQAVERLFAGVGERLVPGGVFYVYGPYRYADRPLEPSNVDFDNWLKARNPHSGIRDFDAVNRLAAQAGLVLAGDRPMPANNRSIWWRKA
jgi:SAM-dependent methyltransferase